MCAKADFQPASHILPTYFNELCVSPASIWTYLAVLLGFGNVNVHYLVDIILPPFGIPTVIGIFGCFLFMGVARFDVMSDHPIVCYSYFRL